MRFNDDLMGNGTKKYPAYEILEQKNIYNNREIGEQTGGQIHHRSLDFI